MNIYSPTIVGPASSNSSYTGTAFIVTAGTASQFLKANGTVDSNAYSLTSHNHAGVYEPVIASGTTAQYWRGDKTWQTLPSTSYLAGTGLTLASTTFNHTNAVTAGNTGDTGATRTLAWSGAFTIAYLTYDAQGHITGTANRVITIPANPNVDTNTYPTTFAWTAGGASGPTGSLTGTSPTIAFAAIPSASASASGIVTTGTQSFAGAKTFTGNVLAANSITNELDTFSGTSKISQVISCTLAEYNAIGTKNVNTLYVII